MDSTEVAVSAERAAAHLADTMRPVLADLERDADRVTGELRDIRSALRTSEDRNHSLAVAYQELLTAKMVINAEKAALVLQLERAAEVVPRPKDHYHDPDHPDPVLVFDLDGTLRESAAYPMMDPPFANLKAALDRFVVRGCCLHIATGGLYYGGEDLDLYFTRYKQISGWVQRFGLPIELFLPKVTADVYYDDRMIPIPDNPDWLAIADQAEQALTKRFDLKDGRWTRNEKKRVGDLITDWPVPDDMPIDQPRGYSGAKIDIDFHRTLSNASSSLREDVPRPDAVKSVRELYDGGVTVQLSCAGWNPATHTKEESQIRLAGLRRWARENGVPYDRIVAKDHGDLYFDDKGIRAVSWPDDMPLIRKRLAKSQGKVQSTEDEYDTEITPTAYNEDVAKGRANEAAQAKEEKPFSGGKDKNSAPETAGG